MNINELSNLLDKEFINVYKNVLINGSWGIGKTYFINQYIKDKEYVKVSLFGINDIENLKQNIYMQLDKKLGFLKKINKTLEGVTIGSISVPYIEGDIKKFLTKKAKNNELLIIIDDLERKSSNILMEDILGLIEEFNKIPDVYVIIIANEEEIGKFDDKEHGIYLSFKEKVIQKTFNITSYSKEARRNIIKKVLEEIRDLEQKEKVLKYIEDFLSKHNILNLRTIEKAMKFLKFIISEIDVVKLKEFEVNAIIIASISVVIEKIENLYYDKNNKKKDSITQVIMNEINNRIVKNYFKEQPLISDKNFIVRTLLEIYDDININENFEKINNYFKSQKEENNMEVSLFYQSKQELEKSINIFYKNSVLKVNPFLDVSTWLKKFAEVNYYATKIGYTEWCDNKKIEKAIDKYVECIPDIENEVKNNFYRLYHLDQYKDEYIVEICKLINQKVYNKYVDYLIEQIKQDRDKNKYDEIKIINLLNNIGNKTKENVKPIIDKLAENKFFLPDFNSTLTESAWSFSHIVWNRMEENTEYRDNKFEKFVKNLIKNLDEVGKYRVNSLNEQYHIDINKV